LDYQHLDYWIDGDLGFLVLDRPEKLNALSERLLQELVAVSGEIAKSEARAVVVAGNGPSFCSGFDVNLFETGPLASEDTVERYELAKLGSTAAASLEELPQITIAALHGHVVGGGVVLAAACDLRVADRSTVFSIPEVDLGIPLAWGGIERLVREFGPMLTKELVLTCRPFTTAEAKQAGFLTAVTDEGKAMDIAKELAAHIADRPRFPVITTKRHVAEVLTGDLSRDDAMGLVTALDDKESTTKRSAYLTRFRDQ
jgi:enoyl-CoA hydratase/carnithine racemase